MTVTNTIKDAKVAVATTIRSLERTMTDLERDPDAIEGCVLSDLAEDLDSQIALLQALRGAVAITLRTGE